MTRKANKIQPQKLLAECWSKYSYIFVFVIILIVYAITINANGNRFNPGHISGILSSQNTVIVGTMAIGMAMVIITGQIDLSLGSSLVLCTGVTIVSYNATGGNVLIATNADYYNMQTGQPTGYLIMEGNLFQTNCPPLAPA